MSFNSCIDEIAEVVMGQSPKGEDVNDLGEGYPLLNGPTEFKTRYPKPVQFTTEGRKFSESGDILFCVRGSTTGKMNYSDQKYAIGRGIAAIRGKNGYQTPYVRAVIERNLDRLLVSATGSTFPNVGRDLLLNFEVDTVSPEDAVSVNELIVSLEDKIELNRQTNQTLEQIAQAIFKSWFVDFEPVKAKVIIKGKGGNELAQSLAAQAIICGVMTLEQLQELENDYHGLEEKIHPLITEKFQNKMGLDYWSPETLQKVSDLFPKVLVESELGKIPEGWECKQLSKMVELIGGGTPKKLEPDYWGGDIPWFSVKDAPNHSDVFVIDTDEKITELGLEKSSTKLLPEGVTIISARGTVGRLALVGVPTAMNQSCYGVKGINNIGPYLNYLNLKDAISMLQKNTHGAVFDTITRDTFNTVTLVEASTNFKHEFEKLVSPIFNKIKNNLFETSLLSDTRDSLLPKLLSGELSVELTRTELEKAI